MTGVSNLTCVAVGLGPRGRSSTHFDSLGCADGKDGERRRGSVFLYPGKKGGGVKDRG